MDPDGTPTLHDLADNMVSAPVRLCAVKIDIKQEHTVEDQDECLLSSFLLYCMFFFSFFSSCMFVLYFSSVPDTAEAEQEGAAAASGPPSLDDTDLEPLLPVRPPPAKFRRGLLSRGIFCRVDGPCPCHLLAHRRAMPLSPGHALLFWGGALFKAHRLV